jgi:hypothetical protein
MTRKDIALTTGGVIASLGLTYLLWRRSQAQGAAQAAAVADSSSSDYQPQPGASYGEYAMLPAFPSMSVSSIAGSGSVTAAGSGSNLGVDPYQQPTDSGSLLFQVLRDYAERMGDGATVESNSYQITAIPSHANETISGIPVTAADARANLVSPGSIVPVSNTTATTANGYSLEIPDTLHHNHEIYAGAAQ